MPVQRKSKRRAAKTDNAPGATSAATAAETVPMRAAPNSPTQGASSPPTGNSGTPIWDATSSDFQKLRASRTGTEEPKEYKNIDLGEIPALLRETQGNDTEWVRRLKAWLPAIAAIKSVTMTTARLDPYAIAPLVVAGTFALVEVCHSAEVLIGAARGTYNVRLRSRKAANT